MAQEQNVNEKPKRTRPPRKPAGEKPYVEQINELLFIHNKEDPKIGVQAVSGIDEKGKAKTVPADEKNENSFLKFEKNSSILENFIKNFWSQLKEPTHFRLIRMTVNDYKRNKQAIKDLSQGKETDAVKEFLKHYEIRPRENKEQSKNEKETEDMAKKQNPQATQQEAVPQQQPAQPQPQEQQAPRYRYNENMVNWDALEKMGISKVSLEQQGLLDAMLKGYKTNKLVPLTLTLPGAKAKLDARLSFITMPDGFTERQVPVIPAEVYGHVFSAQERANLQDGKAILVSDLKGQNNQTFSSYLKVNANSGQLQYSQENPDIRRDVSRRTAQAENSQDQQQEQRRGSRQAV